jgi:hypothetical protein
MEEQQRLVLLEVSQVLLRYPGLRIVPSRDGTLLLRGTLAFTAEGPERRAVTDSYEIVISVRDDYPDLLPSVHETGGRISSTFHRLEGNALCLGSPIRLWLMIQRRPSLLDFVERVIIPYLYGHSLHELGLDMPFGELSHGGPGLLDDLAEMLGLPDPDDARRWLDAARKKKRVANKLVCPCGSNARLGRCHNRRVNSLRSALLWLKRATAQR